MLFITQMKKKENPLSTENIWQMLYMYKGIYQIWYLMLMRHNHIPFLKIQKMSEKNKKKTPIFSQNAFCIK